MMQLPDLELIPLFQAAKVEAVKATSAELRAEHLLAAAASGTTSRKALRRAMRRCGLDPERLRRVRGSGLKAPSSPAASQEIPISSEVVAALVTLRGELQPERLTNLLEHLLRGTDRNRFEHRLLVPSEELPFSGVSDLVARLQRHHDLSTQAAASAHKPGPAGEQALRLALSQRKALETALNATTAKRAVRRVYSAEGLIPGTAKAAAFDALIVMTARPHLMPTSVVVRDLITRQGLLDPLRSVAEVLAGVELCCQQGHARRLSPGVENSLIDSLVPTECLALLLAEAAKEDPLTPNDLLAGRAFFHSL